MAQYCATDYREPINANITRAAVFATPAGTAADTKTADTPDTYRQVRDQKLSSRCANITAQTDPDGPSSPTRLYVQVSAIRTQLAGDQPFQTSPLTSTRRVIQGADGYWRVDIAVDAG